MKKIIFLSLLGLALATNVFGQKTAQVQYAFKDFDGLVVSSGYDVYVEKGDNYSIVITVDAEHAERVKALVSGGILILSVESGVFTKGIKTLKAHITMPRLSSVKLSSGSDLVGNGVFVSESFQATLSSGADMNINIRTEKADISMSSGSDLKMNVETTALTLKSSSGSDAKLTGKAVNASFTASSGSDINAKDLQAHNVTIVASSGSGIKVHAEKTLTVSASSACNIVYSGNPVINANTSGGSSVKKRK
ncbi:MAG: DUF2807 domain-containing protein [Bacteroidales bacterium]|nr:DUF2807 domain-containing protein [Bacteroidales bacterium]